MDASDPPRRTSNSWINLPIHFVTGSFAGQSLRAELTEIQKADLGRKYARVDRRPLDPPPVVLLKLYQVFHHGMEAQYEREIEDYSEVNTLGLLCNVDLYHVPTAGRDPSTSAQGRDLQQAHPSHHHQLPEPPRAPLYHPHSNLASIHQRALTYLWDQPVTEDMNCTAALSGATFIQPALIEYQGRRALVFPFADLAVKTEGQFFLRYRCFDLFSRTSGYDDLPIQAECFGGPFRIYSTKEFPGLQPSTELTKVTVPFRRRSAYLLMQRSKATR
ncbi:velvet factor-domain-containing protein [Boletus reticuloceps]|uniref:Velvet factor-domain-containing protein n=1 Tax=Boletus reticuloceps TaxID=495285 RepID=A0A8I2YX79_9AGAM|nr:velvet factor-domain-containing protein [Boletus reticuloceps]